MGFYKIRSLCGFTVCLIVNNMGTTSTHYVVVGVCEQRRHKVKKWFESSEDRFNFLEKFRDNSYLDAVVHHDGITLIADGMCGNYIVIGSVLAKACSEHGDGLPMTDCKVHENLVQIVREGLQRHFPEFGELSIGVYAFTHSS